ncbi:MAG: SPASM domain-containing protein, partial [Deinococcus sp.]|nr:SPASM domain-containing protein [Deinococcus sp.]
PCPYLPIRVGNVRERSFADLWRSSEVFEDLRHPKLKGRCGACEFAALCGGCRARAYAAGGDYLGEDPGCGYQPEPGATVRLEGGDLSWTEEAVARLERVPPFLRAMVRAGVERYARASGRREITPELMQELRQRMGAAPWP